MARKIGNGLDLLNQKIINLGDPSGSTDAVNKQYVDNMLRGLQWKQPVRAASTANVSVAAPGASLDGVTLAVNDRVLLKNQTSAAENGIYVWSGAAVALTRALDADAAGELSPGTAVTVTEGTTNADSVFAIISDTAVVVGTTAMTWGAVGGGQSFTASNGVQKSGSNFSGVAAPSGGITVGASGFAIDTSIVARKISGNLGNGSLTTIDVAHNFGTLDVDVTLREVSTQDAYDTDWRSLDTNTVRFTFAAAPSASQFRFTIMG